MFWVISVYFNIRNTLPKFCPFLLGHPVYICIGFKTTFYVVRHLDFIASYLPTDLHLGFFRSWPYLYLPSSFSSIFLVLYFVSASTSMLFWVSSFCHSLNMVVPCKLVLFNFFYIRDINTDDSRGPLLLQFYRYIVP